MPKGGNYTSFEELYIDKNGDVREVCVGTNKKNDKQYYYDRPRITGDYHGQAPYLWCATALLE